MPLKYLILCDTLPENPWNRDRIPAIKKALKDKNYSIVDVYDFYGIDIAHETHRTKAKSFFENHDNDDLNTIIYNKIISSRANIILFCTADNYFWYLRPETILKLEQKGKYVVGILGDDEFVYKRNRQYLGMFSKTIAYVKSTVNYYNSLKNNSCLYFPNSCHMHEKIFDNLQIQENEKKHDVMIMGAPFSIRPLLLRKLLDAGIKISIFGSKKWEDYEDLAPYYYGYIPYSDIGNTIMSSKIILAPLEDHITGAMHMNTKIFEAAKYGQMCITSKYLPLIQDYNFIENEDVVMYQDETDLVNKAKFYLSNSKSRLNVSRNIFNKIKDKYDYEILYKKLFIELEDDYSKSNDKKIKFNDLSKVTIISELESNENNKHFKIFNLNDVNSLVMLIEMYDYIITTPYVIFSLGNYIYSSYLNYIVDIHENDCSHDSWSLFPSEQKIFTDEKTPIERVVWKKNAFKNLLLEMKDLETLKNSSYKIHNNFNWMRLCYRG